MTREEAIDILYGIRADNLNLNDAYTKDKYDALSMAINSLEVDEQYQLEYEEIEPYKAESEE